ncbi:MAG: M3 family oligoendopeptidase [Proteobacteria bacterium]|nr:M3 family oligoendopeptidase [Pseudomonadota bacterium]
MQTSRDTWDLSDLYAGPDDPKLAADLQSARDQTAAFAQQWRGGLKTASGAELRQAFEQFEDLIRVAHRPRQYANLRYSVASDDPAVQAELASAQAFGAEIDQKLAFWSVEMADLTEAHVAALGDADAVANYLHYLEFQQLFAAYTLSEDAEQTVTRKDLTGKTSWVNLYMQLCAGMKFEVEVGGEVQTMTRGEVQALGLEPDRALRDRAADAIVASFAPHREVMTFIFNTLFEDHRTEMAARGYDDAMHYPILRDEVPRPVVDSLLNTATESFGLAHRYHAVRKSVMGLDDYAMHDLRVPVFGEEPTVSWDEGRALVMDAFTAFSKTTGELAGPFFDGWIDVFPRPGKSSGAFCSPAVPPEHPWLLLNYTDTMDDVFTLAHEMGHGLHSVLSNAQTPLNARTGKALAETASVFAELWLHEHLMSQTADKARRRQLLDRQIRDAMGTAFHQVAYINWERRAHLARAEGAVDAVQFGTIWFEEMARLVGEPVRLQERDSWRWMAIPHFVFARFYCYSYAFGKLLTLALHGLWKECGDAFVDDYLGFLSAGGSRTPVDACAALGLDLADPGFWQRGCDVVEGWIDELESLV